MTKRAGRKRLCDFSDHREKNASLRKRFPAVQWSPQTPPFSRFGRSFHAAVQKPRDQNPTVLVELYFRGGVLAHVSGDA
jgi:hypothetical protein